MPITIRKKDEVIASIRFETKLHFGLEMLAHEQRRSLNSLVRWAVARLLSDPAVGLIRVDGKTAKNILDDIWHEEESERVLNVAMKYPDFLDPRWQPVWNAVRAKRSLWTKPQGSKAATLDRRKAKEQWDALKSEYMGRKAGRPRKGG